MFFHHGVYFVYSQFESGYNGGKCKYLPNGQKYYKVELEPINVIGYFVLESNQCVISVPPALIKGSAKLE